MVPRDWLGARALRLGIGIDEAIGLPAPYPAAYMEAWLGLIRARSLIAATRLRVWEGLPGTTESLAAHCGARPERLAVLLQMLAAADGSGWVAIAVGA